MATPNSHPANLWRRGGARTKGTCKVATAFTLVEMLLVMLIVALLAALVVPTFARPARDLGRQRELWQLVNLLRDARMAAADGEVYVVRLRRQGEGWVAEVLQIDRDGGERPVGRGRWPRQTPIPEVKAFYRDGEKIDSETPAVKFTSAGVDRDYTIELQGGDDEKEKLCVMVRRPSGLVRMLQTDPLTAMAEKDVAAVESYWQMYCRRAQP